jgi:RHS repeat-associated protein
MSSPKQPWLIRYSYDPLDRLTSQSLSNSPERQRFYCKNRLTTEVQGAIGHTIVQQDNLLLAQKQRHNDGLTTTLLATDLQRSVLHTLKVNQHPQPIPYSPYGHRPAETGLASLLGFNGERSDTVTGDYLLGNGYRAFSPVLMRFNCPDSLSPFGKGGLNAYTYCLGDPINRNDQDGHASFPLRVTLQLTIKSRQAVARVAERNNQFIMLLNGNKYSLRPGISNIHGARMRSHITKQLHLESREYQFDQYLIADINKHKNGPPILETGNIEHSGQKFYSQNKHKILEHIYEKDQTRFPDNRGVLNGEKLLNALSSGTAPLKGLARRYINETWHNPAFKTRNTPSEKTTQFIEAYFIRKS